MTVGSWGRGVAAAAGVLASVAAGAGSQSSPAESLVRLKAGNARFVAGSVDAAGGEARRRAVSSHETPFAMVLTCADSRVPPEVIFNAGLGELFVVRSSGHVADQAIRASLEYGAEHLRTPLLVVMGHDSCGAVRAAIDTPPGTSLGPNLDYLLKAMRPAAGRVTAAAGDARLRAAILENVEDSINDLIERSEILRRLGQSGDLQIVGGYYEMASGRVQFSAPVHVAGGPAAPAAHTAPVIRTAPAPPAALPVPAAAPAHAAPASHPTPAAGGHH